MWFKHILTMYISSKYDKSDCIVSICVYIALWLVHCTIQDKVQLVKMHSGLMNMKSYLHHTLLCPFCTVACAKFKVQSALLVVHCKLCTVSCALRLPRASGSLTRPPYPSWETIDQIFHLHENHHHSSLPQSFIPFIIVIHRIPHIAITLVIFNVTIPT